MDSLTLRHVVEALNSLRGRRLEGVVGIDAWEFHLILQETILVACLHPEHNALFSRSETSGPGSRPGRFSGALEKHLGRTRFAGARQSGLDRVVALKFERRDRLGDTSAAYLMVELTGKGANAIITEAPVWSGRILERLREDRSRHHPRRLAPGDHYVLPHSTKVDVTEASEKELTAALEEQLAKGEPGPRHLVDAWVGVDPATAETLWLRCGGKADTDALTKEWVALANAGPNDERIMSEAEELHRVFRSSSGKKSPNAPLKRAVNQARNRTLRAIEAEEKQRDQGRDAGALRRLGEAVLASAHNLQRGAPEAVVPDPHGDATITVKLNPKLSPAENAELYFKKARKAERGQKPVEAQLQVLRARLRTLESLVGQLDAQGDAPAPDSWLQTASKAGVMIPGARPDRGAPPEEKLSSALRPRRYDLGDGWVALVGKSNRGNEVLTHEIARPHEIWMHADQASGSHLVLRHHEKGKQPPRSLLLAAAAIAAYYCKARHSAKVPVLITEKRYVRRPRKAPLGTVTVTNHKTVMVGPRNPDKDRKPE